MMCLRAGGCAGGALYCVDVPVLKGEFLIGDDVPAVACSQFQKASCCCSDGGDGACGSGDGVS